MLYRILTENKNYAKVMGLVESHLNGATVIQAKGLWKRQWECSLIIETDAPLEIVKELARQIKTMNQQEAVLIQEIPCKSYLI